MRMDPNYRSGIFRCYCWRRKNTIFNYRTRSLSTQLLLLHLLPVRVSARISPQSFLFILWTASLSFLISDSSVGHHMHANDNQLLISFVTSEFSTNISHLQATFDVVSPWNLLSFNQLKTEFLHIGHLPAHTPKSPTPVFSCHLTPLLHQLHQHAILVPSFNLLSLCPITFPQLLNRVSYPSVTSTE